VGKWAFCPETLANTHFFMAKSVFKSGQKPTKSGQKTEKTKEIFPEFSFCPL
jgi:hypothetical protein